jgi:hypothetical protein
MPNFTRGKSFTSTEELTNTKLHTLVEDAAIGVTAITSLTALTDPVADTDTLPLADDSATAIRKVAASNFLKKNASAIFDAGTTRVTGVATPSAASDATTKTYVDTADALKVAKAGDSMTGALAMGSNKITGLGTPTLSADATTKTYVDTADSLKLNLAGGTMSGAINMGGTAITNLLTPSAGNDAANKTYTDTNDALKVSKSGDSMTGALAMGSNKITGLGTPTVSTDAVTKAYVDNAAFVAGNLPSVTSGDNGSTLKVLSGTWSKTSDLTVDSSGNVGIGVTSVGATLDIAKSNNGGSVSDFPSIRVTNTNSTRGNNTSTYNYARIDVKSGNGAVFADFGTRYDSSYSGAYFGTESVHPFIFQTGGTERLRIDSSGNVGIGTTSPAHLLEANSGSANTTVVAAMGGTINGNFKSADYLNTASTSWTFGRDNASTGDFVFKENTAERMRIATTTGNVGVGTASPAYKLTVQSDGTGGSVLGSFVNSTVSNDNYAQLYLGKSYFTNNCGTISYVPNSTSSLSTLRLGLYGSSDTLSINGSGNVGIGNTSPLSNLHVGSAIATPSGAVGKFGLIVSGADQDTANITDSGNHLGSILLKSESGLSNAGGALLFGGFSGHDRFFAGIKGIFANGDGRTVGDIVFSLRGSSSDANLTERLRINSSGNVQIGTTSFTSAALSVKQNADSWAMAAQVTTNGNYGLAAVNASNSVVGGMVINASSTSFPTSSDYRLKTNLEPIVNGIERVKQLPVYSFNWKIDESGNKVDGFIAHEARAIVPESVVGEKDAVDADGNPIYQGIDQSKIVPLLTAALKEAIAEIETLKTKVAALEAA